MGMFDDIPKASSGMFDDIEPEHKKETPSSAESALSGYLDSASFGLHDEIRGASKASGLPEWMGGFRTPVGAARLGYEYLTKPGSATETYQKVRDETRAMRKAAEEENPGSFMAGQIGGGLTAPGLGAARGATMLARSTNAAKAGALQGGLYGFGSGETTEDRAGRAATGTVLGGALGAASAPVVEGALALGRAATKPLRSAWQGIRNPDAAAALNIESKLRRDAEIDPNFQSRLHPSEFASTPEAAVMDLGSENTRALARSAANTSPDGRRRLEETLQNRFENQSDRISGWLNKNYNFPDAHAAQIALDEESSKALGPLYRQSYKEGRSLKLWDDDLDGLVQAPEVQAALRVSMPRLANWLVAEGYKKPLSTFVIKDGATSLRPYESGNTYSPSLQLWDYTKQALDKMGSGPNGSPTAKMFAGEIRQKMDAMLGSGVYQHARNSAAGFFGAGNALDAGQNFVNSKLGNREAKVALSQMSQQERKLFQDGFVSRLVDVLKETNSRRDALNYIANSPASMERLEMVLGSQKAKEFEAVLRVEGIMDLARGAVRGNSTTVRQLFELGLAGGVTGYGEFTGDPKAILHGALTWGVLHGKGAINERVAKRVAEMLASHDLSVVQRGVQMVARHRNLLDQLRKVDTRLARVGGVQSSSVPLIQLPRPIHADEDQPEVPRPPPQQQDGGKVGYEGGFAHGGRTDGDAKSTKAQAHSRLGGKGGFADGGKATFSERFDGAQDDDRATLHRKNQYAKLPPSENFEDRRPEGGGDPTRWQYIKDRHQASADLQAFRAEGLIPKDFRYAEGGEVESPMITQLGADYPKLRKYIENAPEARGDVVYQHGLGSGAKASNILRDAGIPGIKYLDQGSRTGGQGTSNYVLFRDDIIKILRKYGVASVAALPPAVQATLGERAKTVDVPQGHASGGRLPDYMATTMHKYANGGW